MNVVIKQYNGTKWFFVIMTEEQVYSYGDLFIPFLIVRGTEKQVNKFISSHRLGKDGCLIQEETSND